ncbi:hypothetical protein E4U17_006597 [Claviceps sp. LM77 group G4]|nr:hypothetical protein E4U17_006597 [Claviceps sp. LM77 group G4]KAG6077538.1 hypothetical protein E4U16_002185 [Claviceps sp. LM84 group G4]KAG6080735.1 hypothetical protein E4U33_007357 [Claviceps sp. LM78 group G4]
MLLVGEDEPVVRLSVWMRILGSELSSLESSSNKSTYQPHYPWQQPLYSASQTSETTMDSIQDELVTAESVVPGGGLPQAQVPTSSHADKEHFPKIIQRLTPVLTHFT